VQLNPTAESRTTRMTEPTLIPLDLIITDPDTWPRRSLDRDRVALFLDLYGDGGLDSLPPLELAATNDGQYLLTDGWHRFEALYELDAGHAPALVVDTFGVNPWVFAYQRGLETCVTASRPLTRAERRTATERILQERPEMTDVAIARLTGVSNATVGRARRRVFNENTDSDADEPSTGDRYESRHDHNQISRTLVRQLDKLWQTRPLLVASGLQDHARLGDSLAAELINTHGPADALVWAERFQTWATRATTVARQAARSDSTAATRGTA
jgi:hypothetical protein